MRSENRFFVSAKHPASLFQDGDEPNLLKCRAQASAPPFASNVSLSNPKHKCDSFCEISPIYRLATAQQGRLKVPAETMSSGNLICRSVMPNSVLSRSLLRVWEYAIIARRCIGRKADGRGRAVVNPLRLVKTWPCWRHDLRGKQWIGKLRIVAVKNRVRLISDARPKNHHRAGSYGAGGFPSF
jgi:hypothetical protein